MQESEFLSHFNGVQPLPDGSWMAFCSAHPDGAKHGRRSFHISRDRETWLLHCFNLCTVEQIVATAGLTMADLVDGSSNNGSRPKPKERPPLRAVGKREGKPLTAKQIAFWWGPGVPLPGTLGEVYLRSRGITLDYDFPTMRFLPDAPYFIEEKGKPKVKARYPCILTGVADLDGNITGLHRTYLAPSGLDKAPEAAPKKMSGKISPWGARLSPPAQGRVRIAEGIETILSIATSKGLATAQYVAALSASNFPTWEGSPHDELEIYEDPDDTSHQAASTLAITSKLAGRRAFFFSPPPEAGGDFNDLLQQGGAAAVSAVSGVEQGELTREEKKVATRPVLSTKDYSFEGLAERAWKAIQHYNQPARLFRGYDGLVRCDDAVQRLDPYTLRYELARAAYWKRENESGDVPTTVPLDICQDLLAHPRPPLPVLNGFVSHWLMDGNGRLITEPGFDAESGFYVSIPESFVPIEMSVQQALDLFEHHFQDFKWSGGASGTSHANAISLMIAPFIREYIYGPLPIYIVEAPEAGTGKGLLASALLSPAGLGSNILPADDNLVEFHKRIEALIVNYREAVIIDNIVENLDSKTINSMLTADTVEIRQMFTQRNLLVKQRMIWAATVNNPQILGDLNRRSVRIRILNPIELPFLRTDIKDDELLRTLRRCRHEMASAVFAFVKAWVDQGRPERKMAFGSFTHWAKVMGGIFDVIKVPGFEERKPEEFQSPGQYAFRAFIKEWWKLQRLDLKRWFSSSELLPLATEAKVFLGDKEDHRTSKLTKDINKKLDSPMEIEDENTGIVEVFAVKSAIKGRQVFRVEKMNGDLPF